MDEPSAIPKAAERQVAPSEHAAFRIGDWLVEPSLNRLTRGGHTAQLQPKVMDLLVQLARRSGDVVSKSELIDAVWAQEHVSDNVLASAMAGLRNELGDDARSPRYIETIPKRGYRLLVPIEKPDRPADEPAPGMARPTSRKLRPASHYVLFAAVIAVLAAAAALWLGLRTWHGGSLPMRSSAASPRIVVTPFENLGDAAQDHIVAGFTEEITHRLARVSGLRVISRTTALNYDRAGKTIRDIGRDLDVDFVLEGSMRWQVAPDGSASFRLTPQLIRVADDSHLWSATYDHAPDQLFAVQSEIGQRIVDELNVTLRDSERAVVHASPMTDISVYQLYLLGTNHLLSGEKADFVRAVDLFEQVIARAPDFAPAYARLSEAHGLLVHLLYDTSPGRLGAARVAVERAHELAPDLPEVHRALGLYYYRCERDLVRGRKELEMALRGLPNDSDVLASIGFIERREGHWADSVECLSRALEIDPLNVSHLWNQSQTLSLMRQFAEADRLLDRAIAAAPGMLTPHILKAGNALRWTGDPDLARAVLEVMPPARDEPLLARWSYLLEFMDRRWQPALDALAGSQRHSVDEMPVALLECRCYRWMGRPDEMTERCLASLATLEQQQSSDPWDLPGVLMAKAQAYALLGDRDHAIQHADRAFALATEQGDAVDIGYFGVVRARVYAEAGLADDAIEQLRHWLSVPAPISVAELRIDPLWDGLRDRADFQQLIAKPLSG